MQKRTRSDSPTKSCTVDGCDRPLRARGKCVSCYNNSVGKNPDRHARTKIMQCFICDKEVLRAASRGNRYTVTCSNECKKVLTFGTPLPEDHWARWWGKTSNWTAPKAKEPEVAKFISNNCDDCGSTFIERNTNNYSKYCSERCARRVSKRARKAREHNAPGNYRWTEVISLWIAAGRRCSYCDQTMTEQPDPDHVIAISRGGRNDIGNIVPCCRQCNGDKGDQTLTEWADERARLGKPARRYSLPFTDPRFTHLTLGEATGMPHRKSLDLAA